MNTKYLLALFVAGLLATAGLVTADQVAAHGGDDENRLRVREEVRVENDVDGAFMFNNALLHMLTFDAFGNLVFDNADFDVVDADVDVDEDFEDDEDDEEARFEVRREFRVDND